MNISTEIVEQLENVADIAKSLRKVTSYFLIVGLMASAYLVFVSYKADAAHWWNIAKICLICFPVFIWAVFVYVIGQLQDIPEAVQSMVSSGDSPVSNVKGLVSGQKKVGIRNLFSLIWAIKSNDGFGDILGVVSGFSLFVNPFFAVLLFLCSAVLSVLILIAIVMLIL